jgi:hypothetical protein
MNVRANQGIGKVIKMPICKNVPTINTGILKFFLKNTNMNIVSVANVMVLKMKTKYLKLSKYERLN